MGVPRCQLRIFAPLEAFPEAQRRRWAAYVREQGGVSRAQFAEVEATAARRLLVGSAPAPDAALVRRRGDTVLVCPVDLDARAASSLRRLRGRVPGDVVEMLVPDGRLRERLEQHPDGRPPHVLDEPWVVPFHWLLAFTPSERRVRTGPDGHMRARFATEVQRATTRLVEVAETLDLVAAEPFDALVDDVSTGVAFAAGLSLGAGASEVLEWLVSFDERALLELDYGTVAESFTPEELAEDDTCGALWEVVAAFRRGEPEAALVAYDDVRSRWGSRWARQFAN